MENVEGELCDCTRGVGLHFDDCLFKFYERERVIHEGWSKDKVDYTDNFNELIVYSYSRFDFGPIPSQVNNFDSLVRVNSEFLLESYKRYKQSNYSLNLIEGRLVFLERQYDTLRSHFVR